MKPKLQKTYSPKPGDIHRSWFVVDADGATLGRLASEIATILRGKNKPMFAPHMDVGDHVIVINASKVFVTGNKEEDKMYFRHSGFPGGLREVNLATLRATHPQRIIESAVRGMLPKNRLGRQMIKKMKVYAGPEHPHAAQDPQPLELGKVDR